MAAFDEDQVFGKRPAAAPAHVLGQSLDDLSAPELVERIATLKREIERLEAAIRGARDHASGGEFVFQDLKRAVARPCRFGTLIRLFRAPLTEY